MRVNRYFEKKKKKKKSSGSLIRHIWRHVTHSSGLAHHGREDKARPAEAAPGGGEAPRTGPDPAGGT